MGDTYVPRFWPPFFTLAGSSTIFLGYFFSSTNSKAIFWGTKTTNYKNRSFWPKIQFFPRSFWVQFSAASGTPPSVFRPSTPPPGYRTWLLIGRHYPLATGLSKYTFGLPQSQWFVDSCDRWEFPPFFIGYWEFPCTALSANNLPAVRAVQGDCERVYSQTVPAASKFGHWTVRRMIDCARLVSLWVPRIIGCLSVRGYWIGG